MTSPPASVCASAVVNVRHGAGIVQALVSSPSYRAGDLDAEADYYRLHFDVALKNRDALEQVVRRLRAHFTPAGVLAARAIEQRLYDETWERDGYDLIPKLRHLEIPSLVLHGGPAAREARRSRGLRPFRTPRSAGTRARARRGADGDELTQPNGQSSGCLSRFLTNRSRKGHARRIASARP